MEKAMELESSARSSSSNSQSQPTDLVIDQTEPEDTTQAPEAQDDTTNSEEPGPSTENRVPIEVVFPDGTSEIVYTEIEGSTDISASGNVQNIFSIQTKEGKTQSKKLLHIIQIKENEQQKKM
jgi:hypothetical protein